VTDREARRHAVFRMAHEFSVFVGVSRLLELARREPASRARIWS